jgi:hypothetical protein
LKAFVSKPVQIAGKQFDGTRESAKELINWIKSDPTARYNSAELRENVNQFGFDSTGSYFEGNRKTLNIDTDVARYFLHKGDWLVRFIDTGGYTTYDDQRLRAKYAEL